MTPVSDLVLIGRSSSHFTRVARIFAAELAVEHAFRPLSDLMSVDPADYGGNPALKIPVLVDERGPLFGTENICRELARRSSVSGRVVLRGDTDDRLVLDAEELTLHLMAANVTLIVAKLGEAPEPPKVRASVARVLARLDEDLERVLARLPADRTLSFLEAALFAAVTHFPFRAVTGITVAPYESLGAFVSRFGARESARATEYRFDT